MKLSLIQPPLSPRQRYGGLASAGNTLPNLGMLGLAAIARERGASVQFIDAAALNMPPAEVASRAAAFGPDAVGLTAVTSSAAAAAAVANEIRRALPSALIMLGGPHVTAVPEETLTRFKAFDVAVVGEGEITLSETIDSIADGSPLDRVAGLVIRRDGALVRTPQRGPIPDLDSLPLPAWDLLERFTDIYRPSPQSTSGLPSTILFTTRGCPYRCTFCDRTVFGNRPRYQSAERVVETMEHLSAAYGIADFAIHDEIFVLDRERVESICETILRRGLEVSWNAQARADRPLQAATLALMRRAGCWQLQFGIESGDPEMLDRTCKGITIDQARESVRAAVAAGMSTKAFFMLGLPGETEQSLGRTADLALELPLDDITVTFFTPFPGTEAAAGIEKHGEVAADWRTMSEYEVAFVPRGLTARNITKARAWLLTRFYLRPRIVASYAGRLARPGMFRPLLRGGLGFASVATRGAR